jgi:F-type H+-transporting ATPase subunit a
MYLVRIIIVSVLLAGLSASGWTSNAAAASAAESHGGEAAHVQHVLTPYAIDLWKIGPLTITNSMLVTWIVALGVIIFAQVATRRIQEVPSGVQNFWEWLVESLYEFLEGIIGSDLVRKTFWFFASIFVFLLFANWAALVPGVGTIGWGVRDAHGFHVTEPLFRGAAADLNLTLAIAMVFFVCWGVWALQANGPMGFLKHLFAPKGDASGPLKLLLIVVFFAVGFLEIISIMFRPVSLSFRLYGNIYAGEIMLESMAHLVPSLAWLVPIPFYFLELLVGLVQALVFMLLTAIFTMLICQHDEEHAQH